MGTVRVRIMPSGEVRVSVSVHASAGPRISERQRLQPPPSAALQG
jgi:hypothetical protein